MPPAPHPMPQGVRRVPSPREGACTPSKPPHAANSRPPPGDSTHMGPPRSRVLWVLAHAAPRGPSLALPALQLWEISSGELLLSVLFDVGIMAVTMDLAEHHMFCGGSDGSIFQVDLCTWVSDGRPRPPQLPVHHEATPLTRPRPPHGPLSILWFLVPQPGQSERSFQPEQEAGKVFRGHRWAVPHGDCMHAWPGLLPPPLERDPNTVCAPQEPGHVSVGVHGQHPAAVRLPR